MRNALRVTRKAVLFLGVLTAAGVWSRPVAAQPAQPHETPSSPEQQQQDMQQLRVKLQQLEQMMGEVKAQMEALESQAPQPAPVSPSKQTGAGVKGTEQAGPLIAVPSEAIIRPQADPVPLEGEITEEKNTFNIYGFTMLDSGYDFGQNDRAWFDVVRPVKLPSFANQFAPSGNVYASVRQTRFGVKSSSPTPLGDLNTVFEWELYGTGVDAGQTTLRLRHAYGELGAFGAGQTWSPFMDIGVFPNTVEYWGPSGMAFFRNVQVRWMPIRKKSGSVTIALERPGASGDQGVYADRIELSNIQPRFNFPDLSGNGRIDREWGYLQVAGIVRKIGWVDTSGNKANLGGSVVGWGVDVTSNLNLSTKNVAKLGVVYGHGIENYMNDAPFDVGIKTNPPGSRTPIGGVALPVLGVTAFLDHSWSERYTSSAGYSMVNIWNSNGEKVSDYHQGHYAVANLLFHPIPKVMMGGEFQFGRRVNFLDGFNYNDYRMQFSFKYDFGKSFKSPSF